MNSYEVRVFSASGLELIKVKQSRTIIGAQYCFAEMCEWARVQYKSVGCYVYLYDLELNRDILRYSCSMDSDCLYEELIPCHHNY